MASSSGFSSSLPPNSVWGESSAALDDGGGSPVLDPNSVWGAPASISRDLGASQDLVIPSADVTKIKKIAIGAFGTVYEGSWQHTRVAIKKLNADLPEEEQVAFNKETELMRRLRHPHVVMLYGVTKDPNSLIMEYMSGGTLYDKLKSSDPFDWRLREQIALDIAKGLAYLHSVSLFHRDLKSNNVLLDDNQRAKIADFGLSQIKLFSTCTARYGHFRWAAPELLSEAVTGFNAQCDIYSLGMVFWELASRKLPFADSSDTQVFNRVVVRKEYGQLPEETTTLLRNVIYRTWDFDPSKRARLDQIIEELKRGLAAPSIPVPSPSLTVSPSSKGDGSREFALGQSYEKNQNLPRAIQSYRTAATFGHPQAQYQLGYFHEIGQGVAKDLLQAIKFYELASTQGLAEAQQRLNAIARGEFLSLAPPAVAAPKPPTTSPSSSSSSPSPIRPSPVSSAPLPAKPSSSSSSSQASSSSPSLFSRFVSFFSTPDVPIPSIAFGPTDWNRYFGDVGVAPPLPPNIDKILAMPCPFWPSKKLSETHLLTLIPAKVDGRPLTLDSLGQLIQAPKSGGRATKYRYYWKELKKQEGSKSVRESYWVLMTQDVLPGTLSKSYVDQKRLLEEQVQKVRLLRGGVPTLLEAATSILMEHVRTERRLYGDAPWRWTRCQEACQRYQTGVGGFAAAGLSIYNYVHENCGLACSWKF